MNHDDLVAGGQGRDSDAVLVSTITLGLIMASAAGTVLVALCWHYFGA